MKRKLMMCCLSLPSSLVAFLILVLLSPAARLYAQESVATDPVRQELRELREAVATMEDYLQKNVDNTMFFRRLEDIAAVDIVRYTSAPPRVEINPTAQGVNNPVTIPAYTFLPRKAGAGKIPLIVLVHGGVHANFDSGYVHILRELLEQGYGVIAPEYRGSSGYGRGFYRLIDYGGLETEDVFAGKQWMVENYPQIDPQRIGVMGWSHGGMITLMNIFEHPKDFAVAYAGVPVSDLVARMGYKSDRYRGLFSADYHIGKTAEANVAEYRRRSPINHVAKLQTPLLVHTTTNDEDVNVLEVESLISALTAAGKQFEHKIYKDAPGGHHFNRIDTRLAKESRAEIYRFLAKYLNPPQAVR